jgi:ferredoxin-NADP reductase
VPNTTAWQAAKVLSMRAETARVKTIRFEVNGWTGHLPGQHADVRLTADDGYRAERSYPIASPPEDDALEITVERLEQGEVSPYLTSELQPGESVELRGPIGGHFVWFAAGARNPLLLIAGGSGVVPLVCVLRHWLFARGPVPAALLYSSRALGDLIFHEELRELADANPQFALQLTLTRHDPPNWSGATGCIHSSLVGSAVQGLRGVADSFVCGPARFVEAASVLLQAGVPAAAIRSERFGARRGWGQISSNAENPMAARSPE